MKAAFFTLGCKVNHYETAAMEELFLKAGHEVVPFESPADVYIVNTCTVTMTADKKSRQMIARAHALSPLAPVIAVGCYSEVARDKVEALDAGADDYISKPFGMMEMVSRIRAVLRRAAPAAAPGLLQMGNLRMDSASHTVYAGDTRVELTLKEFELLKLFLEHPGRVFTRDQLLERIWSTDYVGETRTVDVHIGTLRTKLGQCGEYIRTVRGVGYRMEA